MATIVRRSAFWPVLLVLLVTGLAAPRAGAADLTKDQERVIDANTSFYKAFRSHDLAAMDAIWSRSEDVAVIHPGWPGLAGREQVMRSWRLILRGGAPLRIRCVNPEAHVYGDSAFVVCYEDVDGNYLVATNIFVREDGAWRMVHHQAGPSPAPSTKAPEKRL